MKVQMEAHEREENMKAQWKQWEQKMQMAQNFDTIGYEMMEMKHKYYYMVTMSFMQFCKCSDFAANIKEFFHHDVSSVHFCNNLLQGSQIWTESGPDWLQI